MRVEPAAWSPLMTSVYPVSVPACGSSVSPPELLTLSKMRFDSSPVNVKRNIAAWSVGVISVFRPSSNVTP